MNLFFEFLEFYLGEFRRLDEVEPLKALLKELS